MNLASLVTMAGENGASDLHLEPGLPPALRIRGALQVANDPLAPQALLDWARSIIPEEHWPDFLARRSYDLSSTIAGIRCRINVLHTSRGVGFAIRLLSSFHATIESLNLHSDLRQFLRQHNGLILVCGPTGSGKSSTMAALIEEINATEARHIVTVENPIEYSFRPKRSYIRQREVGRDTPSFEQALLDALREDPDVLMVGEMRDPETMRLTLNASETGHLVLATIHSSSCVEALQRLVGAFPADIQNSVAAQLADCLVGVVAQRLKFRPDLNIRLPECEILVPTNPVKNFIRNRDFFKIISVLETGADFGMWTFQRYSKWMERRTHWALPADAPRVEDEPPEAIHRVHPTPVPATAVDSHSALPKKSAVPSTGATGAGEPGRRIEIEPDEGGLSEILKKLK